MTYSYKPKGVCSRNITIKLDGDIIEEVIFEGACSGNTQGISALVKGMNVNDVIERCENILCGRRGTSCPDQLAKALKEAKIMSTSLI